MPAAAALVVGSATALCSKAASARKKLLGVHSSAPRPSVGCKRGWATNPPVFSRPGRLPARDAAQQELYPAPGWPWQYPAAKPGTTLADGWFLWITQAAHYAIFVSQLALAYRIFQVVQLPAVAAATALPFWAIMCPVFQALAGFGPVLMHEYEGWQIAPFREPPVDNSSANNQQLREAAFRVLFQWQGIAAAFAALGVFGLERWTLFGHTLAAPIPLVIYLAGLAALYFGPRFPTLLFDPSKVFPCLPARRVFPVPASVLPPFALATLGYAAAQAHFYGAALGGGPRWGLAAAIVVVNLLGGVLEGLVAESTFNQFWHLMAVAFLNAGGWLQVWLLRGL